MANIVQILQLVTQADSSGLTSAASGLDDIDSKGSSLVSKLGSGLQTIVTVGAAAGVAAAGLFTAAIGAASSLQDSMSKIQGLAGATAEQTAQYQQQILDLTSKLPISAKDAADGLYYVISSGYQGADAMQVLSVSAEAAAAGLGSTKDVAALVTAALTDYKLGASDAKTITDQLTAAVTDGRASASEFAPAMARVLPIAQASGVGFDQVAASISTMTRAGLSADEAGTALRGTLAALEKPGQQAKDALESVGLSAEDVQASIRDKGLLVTLQDLMDKTGGNVETLGMIIPNIRALTGVLSSAGSQGDSYAKTLDDIQNSAGRTDKAFAVAQQNVSTQITLIKNDVMRGLIELGDQLLPIVTPILNNITSALPGVISKVQKFFNDDLKGPLTGFAGFIASTFMTVLTAAEGLITTRVMPALSRFGDWWTTTALPAIREVISYLQNTAAPAFEGFIGEQIVPRAEALWGILQQVGAWFKTVALPAAVSALQAALAWVADHKETVVGALIALAAAQALVTAAEVAGAVAAAAANLPLIALIVTIAAVGAGIALLITHWDDITRKFPLLGEAVNDSKRELQDFVDWLTGTFWPKATAAFSAVVTWVSDHWGTIKALLTGPIEIAQAFIVGQFDLIKDSIKIALDILGGIITVALDLISGNWKGAWGDVKKTAGEVWTDIQTLVGNQITAIGGILNGSFTLIRTALAAPFEWFRDNIGGIISAAINFLVAPLNIGIDAFNTLGRTISGAVNWITGKLGLGDVLGQWKDLDGIHVNLSFAPAAAQTGIASLVSGAIGSGLTTIATAGSGSFAGLATGGGMPEGFSWLGEQGAELVHKQGSNVSVIPNRPSMALAATLGMNVPGFFGGTPDWGDTLGDIAGAIKSAGSSAIDFAKEWASKGVGALVDTAFNQFGVKAPSLPGALSGIGGAVFGQVKDKIVAAIQQLFDKGKSALGTAQPGTPAQVDAWIQQAIAATGVPLDWEQGLDIIADYESNGDPSAINATPVSTGEHAQGLMQTIPSTFAAYAMAGHGDINNPVDNAIASIRYILARYGTITNVPGVASVLSGGAYLPYASGGLITEPVIGIGAHTGSNYLFGEAGPEVVTPLDGGKDPRTLGGAGLTSGAAFTSPGLGGDTVTAATLSLIAGNTARTAMAVTPIAPQAHDDTGILYQVLGNIDKNGFEVVAETKQSVPHVIANAQQQAQNGALLSQLNNLMADAWHNGEWTDTLAAVINADLTRGDIGQALIDMRANTTQANANTGALYQVLGNIDKNGLGIIAETDKAIPHVVASAQAAAQNGAQLAALNTAVAEAWNHGLWTDKLATVLNYDLSNGLIGTALTDVNINLENAGLGIISAVYTSSQRTAEQIAADSAALEAYRHATGYYASDHPAPVNTGPSNYVGGGVYGGFGGNSGVPFPPDPYGGGVGMARFALGGVLTEPVAGIGLTSGRRYLLGEAGPEAVVPLSGPVSGRSGGSVRPGSTNNTFNVTIPAKDIAEMQSVADFFARIEQEQRARG